MPFNKKVFAEVRQQCSGPLSTRSNIRSLSAEQCCHFIGRKLHFEFSQEASRVSSMLRASNIQRTSKIEISSPILWIRGGGADQKRKEARKRKLAPHRNEIAAPQSAAESNVPPEKKSKKATSSPRLPESITAVTEHVSNVGKTDQSLTFSKETSKPQRFIVFIGTQGLSPMVSNCGITNANCNRQSAFLSNRPNDKAALCQSSPKFNTPSYTERYGKFQRICIFGIREL